MSIKMNDIDNTKLEEAMQVYMKDQDKENLIKLVYAIQETKLFVPAMAVQKKEASSLILLKMRRAICICRRLHRCRSSRRHKDTREC